MRKWALVIAVAAAIFGGTLAAMSTSQHFRIQREGFSEQSFCSISETVNCDIVNASSYSEFFGVPVAWWGLTFYFILLCAALYGIFKNKKSRSTITIAWIISASSLFYCAYLAYIAFFVLNVICIECIGMYLANITIFIFLFVALKIRITNVRQFIFNYLKALFGKNSEIDFNPMAIKHIIIIASIFLISWIVIGNVQAKNDINHYGTSTDKLIKYYYLQSLYSVDINKNWPVWGNPDAKVTIIEFSEFQCPFCRMSSFQVKPYLQEFKKHVRYYFVNYPLDNSCNDTLKRPMHKYACFASKAGICADKKGKFWVFHDDLFRNQKKLNENFILSLAEKYGWSKEEFKKCIESPKTNARLKNDLKAGHKIYVSYTPTIILDGRILKYWRNPDFIRKVVGLEIKKMEKSDEK